MVTFEFEYVVGFKDFAPTGEYAAQVFTSWSYWAEFERANGPEAVFVSADIFEVLGSVPQIAPCNGFEPRVVIRGLMPLEYAAEPYIWREAMLKTVRRIGQKFEQGKVSVILRQVEILG